MGAGGLIFVSAVAVGQAELCVERESEETERPSHWINPQLHRLIEADTV